MREDLLTRQGLYLVSEDKIFIGYGLGFPIVGKLYSRKEVYDNMLKQITSTVDLITVINYSKNSDVKHFIVPHGAYVMIEEKLDCTFIKVTFSDNSFSWGFEGITDNKGPGFHQFLRAFYDLNQLAIILLCEESREESHFYGIASTGEIRVRTLTPYIRQ